MHSVLIIGAGRSSSSLITYMLNQAAQYSWHIIVADANIEQAQKRVNNHPNGRAVWLDVNKANDRRELISRAGLVISLLPAHLHLEVAHDCIRLNKHLITASYVTHELYRLGDEARERELIFMGEMGLDPGVDHMSAKKVIDEIHDRGGTMISFRSYTGGLIAPESDNNPWHYKFSWNPRNVVLAGQGTAQYLENGKYKYIPYHRLFRQYRNIEIPGVGEFEVYANRDSLLYRDAYGLKDIPNLLRGTLRHPGFCDAWSALVRIGLTDGSYPILESEKLTYHEFMEAYLRPDQGQGSVKDRTAKMLGLKPEGAIMRKLDWLGLFRKKRIGLANATPALILEKLLLDKWEMKPNDKDMIVMHHEFEYEVGGREYRRLATLVMKGENREDTAMARLVGLPMGIFGKLVLQGKINATGVHIPVIREVYKPVLEELAKLGVAFEETETEIASAS